MLFTEEQAEKVLGVRREHLRRLHRIYEDRRQVNLEAISVLVSNPKQCKAKTWLIQSFGPLRGRK